MIKLKDGYAKLIGTTATGSANNVLLSNGGDKIIGNASGNIPLNNGSLNVNLNAEKINGYTSALLWRSNGATWNPTANITMTPTANNLEWSFDFRNKSGFTGSYWNVWDESKETLLRVEADSGKVKAPYGFVGNLEGVATTASSAAKWTTARTLTVGNAAKTVDGSADVTWDLESILKNPTIIGTTTSWDITVPGVYGVTSVNKFSGTSNPEYHTASGEVYRYGLLIVSKSGHGLALFYISHRDSDVSKYGIKYRTGYNSTYVSEWARLLDTLNYEKYVVKLDGHSLLWNNLYYTYKEVTMDTPDTVWYVKIVLSAYAQPNLIMINTGYNNRADRAFLQFTGLFLGYFYRNNCQNQGNLTGLCLKTGYDSVEKKWIFWLRFKPISSTAAEGPATSATCKVYLGQSNNAFDISATTTEPEGVTWETVGTAYTSLLLRYATIRGNLIGNSDSATKAYLTYNNTSTAEYPIIWSNSNNTTSLNGSLFKSYSDLTYSPSNKRLTVKGLVTSPLFFYNLTSASANPIIYIGSNNLDTTLLRVYSSDAADTSTFTGRYGYSLKYLGSDSNNRLALMADNGAATTLNVAIAFTNAGNVGIRDYANSDFSLHVSGKTNILTTNFVALWIRRLSSNLGASIGFHNTLGTLGYLGMKDVNGGILRWSADTYNIYKVWDEGNDGPGSGLNADLLDNYQETDFFRSCRGNISTDYVDIDVFSNGDSRFKVVDPGTYSISRSNYSELFINFKGEGSTSGLEFKTNYNNNARLCIRKTVDSKRISGVWKELAFYDDIATKLDGYYWANIKISSTSSKYTLPTFLNLFIDTYDATLKIYSGRLADAKSDGNICFQTCMDELDGQSHSYASSTYASRLNLVLLPRAGQVYIGVNPEQGNTAYKLYVNGAIYGTRFAGPADKLTTARTIALGEAVQSTATAFDGSANISIPVTGLKESYLVWGDKNKVNDLGVIDNCFSDFSSNKLSFMNPDLISVEYSNDGGSTWTDYGATAEQKTAHVTSTLSQTFYLGNNKAQTTLDRLRITITAANGNLYFAVRKLMVYFCMNGATGNTVLVETSKCGSDTTFTALGTYSVSGWTGWNSIPVSFSFGGADTQTGNTRRIRFTYQFTGHSSGYESKTAAYVQKTYMFGAAQWSSPHSLSSTGHLYSFDANLRALFPKLVEATSGFKKTGSNDNYVLLGGGGHKAISSFYWADIPITTSATTNKKPTLGGIIFSGGSESFDQWGNFKFGASGTSWNVLKNDGTTSLMKITASSGNMTVLGSVTAPTFIGNLNGDITKKTPQLCAATESDNINIVENANGAITNNYISNLTAIRKAILFKWYSTYWQIGNIRGSASGTDGFGVTYGSDKLCFRVTEAASYVYGNMYAVHFYESSDKRLKTNIQEILNSDKMPTIKEFDWKEDGSHSYGLIAQELEEQGYSELVSTKDNGYKTVNYSAALSLIVGKLQAKIKELEKEIENLKNKN